MLGDITIGQFFPGDTLIHKLDPRIKILLVIFFIILLFVNSHLFWLLATMALILLAYRISHISFKLLLKNVKPLLLIIILTSIINMFSTQGEVIFSFYKLSVTKEGLILSLVLIVRILNMIMISSLLTYTTSPLELTVALEKLLMPLNKLKVPVSDLSMMMTIALRFIPTLTKETEKIMLAQKSRGAQIGVGNIFQKIKSFIPVVIPLFVSAFRSAEELAVAMECRCYNSGKGKTSVKQLAMGKQDFFVVGFIVVFFVSVFCVDKILSAHI